MKNELELLKLALVDYKKGHEVALENHTNWGFCLYFKFVHSLNVYLDMEVILPTLYRQRKVPGGCHYSQGGYTIKGNADRVTALRNAIKEIER